MSPRAGLDAVAKRKMSVTGNRTPIAQSSSIQNTGMFILNFHYTCSFQIYAEDLFLETATYMRNVSVLDCSI